jgi:hypothetical protein
MAPSVSCVSWSLAQLSRMSRTCSGESGPSGPGSPPTFADGDALSLSMIGRSIGLPTTMPSRANRAITPSVTAVIGSSSSTRLRSAKNVISYLIPLFSKDLTATEARGSSRTPPDAAAALAPSWRSRRARGGGIA